MARQPEDLGLLPDGAKSQEEAQAAYHRRSGLESEYSWRVKEALKTKALWLLVLSFVVGGLATSSVVLHEISYVRDQGYSATVAAAVLSTHATMALTIRPVWGLVLERIPVRYCMAAVYLGAGLALGILLTAHSLLQIFLFAVVYGMSIAGHAVSHAIVFANYFGRDYIGTIRGVVTPITSATGAIGPLLVSVVYDTTGTYSLAFGGMMVLSLAGAALVLLAKPPVKVMSLRTG